ncbi:MAG: hypothetical protein ACYTFK_00880 [Planctomycetota bacterium]|jgi:hypothetical protein
MPLKRVFFLSLLLVVIFFVPDASATLGRMLPESTHYQGFTWYNQDWENGLGDITKLRGRIDFAVYDTLGANGNEFTAAGYDSSGDGRYIYAYQIFNDYDGYSEEAVAYFEAIGIDMAYVDIHAIGSQEDPSEGIEPTEQYFSDEDEDGVGEAVWDFGLFDADLILAGKHSWFLSFSSNQDWVRGDYAIKGAEPSDFPTTPEPGVLTLLSIGGAMLFRSRRNISRRRGQA